MVSKLPSSANNATWRQILVMLSLRFTMLTKDFGPIIIGMVVSVVFVGASVGIGSSIKTPTIPEFTSAIPINFNTSAFVSGINDGQKQMFAVGSVVPSTLPSQTLDGVIAGFLKSPYTGTKPVPVAHFESFSAISIANINRANASNSTSLPYYGAGYRFNDSTIGAFQNPASTGLGYVVAIDPSVLGTTFLAMESIVALASNYLYTLGSGQNISMPPVLGSYGLFNTKVRIDIGSSIVPPFLTNAVTFVFSTFAERMVTFREEGYFDLLFISGMTRTSFFVSAILIDLTVYLIIALFCFVLLYAFSLKFFIESSFAAFAFPTLSFGLAVIAQAYYTSFFFKKGARVGPSTGILQAIVVFVPYFIVYVVFNDTIPVYAAVIVSILMPQFGIYRCYNDIASSWTKGMAYTLPDTLDLVNRAIPQLSLALLASTVLYSLLVAFAAYLNATNQTMFGFLSRRKLTAIADDAEVGQNGSSLLQSNGNAKRGNELEDDEVAEETRNINSGHYNPADVAVLVSNVRKVFPSTAPVRRRGKAAAKPNDKVALDGMNLVVRKNEIHGLLGHNGAGKSTLITILSGLQPATSGTAYLDAHVAAPVFDPSIRGTSIGLCPQFSTLFPRLSPLDHIRAFARRLTASGDALERGWWNVEEEAVKTLKSVGLSEEMWTRPIKGLSGGNKRKVSIALAILGNPAVIFLDEPTTGVDVAIRQEIWETIRALKTTSSVVLTTHSLEEADALSDRISIVVGGRLRVLGTPQRLKHAYARTHTLTLKLSPSSSPSDVLNRVRMALPGLEVTNVFGTVVKARMVNDIGAESTNSAEFYENVFAKLGELGQETDGLIDAEVGDGSLTEVFVGLVNEHEQKEGAAAAAEEPPLETV